MELSTITTFFSNPSGWGLLLILALVIERLITGGYLRLIVGKKTIQDARNILQDGRDTASDSVLKNLVTEMQELKLHFNHETTEQNNALLRGQEKILDILNRIERDGIRVKT